MSWNYRIGTKVFSYKVKYEGKNEELAVHPDTRLYSIVEVYYDENDEANGYAEVNPLNEWETVKDLEGTYKLIKAAFNKPILDLDNFPNIFPDKTTVKKLLIHNIIKNSRSF